MYLFGLEGSGFIISLGLIFFMSGLIMFYCLRRFSLIENSIIDQGRILQSFIIKTQEQGMVGCPQHPATNRAIASALEQSKDDSLYSTKIDVSDEGSESEYETETNSEATDDEDDDDDDDNDEDQKQIFNIDDISNFSLTDLNQSDKTPDLDSVKVISIEDIQHNLTPDLTHDLTQDILNINSDSSESNLDNSSIEDMEQLTSINVNKLNVSSNKLALTKMKVGELRTLVVENNLIDNMDTANKIKKEDLIKILQK
jgi:hypothetical protein